MRTLTIYVAPAGNDAWSGRFPEPNAAASDGPVATPACARDRARALRAAGAAVRVVLRGGVYELDEPLRLTAADSGTAKAPAIFAAYPGEVPVLSGGRRLGGWKTDTVNGQACWRADLPEVKAGRWNFTQLFVNGERRFRPRLPKTGFYRFTDVPAYPKGFRWHTGPDVVGFAPGDIQDWRNQADLKIVVLELFFDTHHRVKAIDVARRRVEFRCKSIGGLLDLPYDGRQLCARYFVDNVFEALSEPGEFYLERATGRLYYLPRPGEDPATAEVVAPRLAELLVLDGTAAAPVRHVHFENIAFRHAEWDYAPDVAGSVQAAWRVPGTVVLKQAEDCVLYGCEVSRVAQYGVEIRNGSAGNRIVACAIFNLGAGGIRIGHDRMDRTDETQGTDTVEPARRDGRRMATMVSDCEIHDGGRIHYGAIGLWIGNSGGNRIFHNHIHHFNYSGLSCGWTWGYAATATVDNRIEYNHIHHINWERLLGDNGAIYILGRQPGGTLRGNVVHHIGCYSSLVVHRMAVCGGEGGWGIYPDEGASEMIIEDNLVYGTDDAAYSTHYGRDNIVRNNIFALSGRSHINPGKQERHRTNILEHNLVFWHKGAFHAPSWPLANYLCRHNLFWNGKDADPELGGGKLSAWMARGQHLGSVAADPLFLDPAAGDFTLRADSPALALGFKPFDPRRAGPRLAGKRPAAFADWPAEKLDYGKPIVHTEIEETPSGKLRVTVTNFGQKPATGKLRLRCQPAGALAFAGVPVMSVARLRPGQSRSMEFAVSRRQALPDSTVETLVAGNGFIPTLIFLKNPAGIPK